MGNRELFLLARAKTLKSFIRKALVPLLYSLALAPAWGDRVISVSDYDSLRNAIHEANASGASETITIQFASSIDTTGHNDVRQLLISLQESVNLVVDGNNHTLNMAHHDRAFFIVQGNVTFSNLTIQGGYAKGGDGASGGGGGMGAGGAIYASNLGTGTYVHVSNVSFHGNSATGGKGGNRLYDGSLYASGGGGGMGGDGGHGRAFTASPTHSFFGGGGGFGRGATGGTQYTTEDLTPHLDGQPGDLAGYGSGGSGLSSYTHGVGGAAGGGGGASHVQSQWTTAAGGAGGGGVNGANGEGISGGNGGYGGGGGGGFFYGGQGGYGGGGGAGDNEAGTGGFGGGGGADYNASRSGGFGGGNSSLHFGGSPAHWELVGGGGMGAGGAIFVEKGAQMTIDAATTFSGNSAAGGEGGAYAPGNTGNGLGIGDNIFFGNDVTFAIDSGTVSLSGLGGGGDTSDSRIGSRDTHGYAQGGLVKTGAGTLRLTGNITYAGTSAVVAGRLTVATSSIFTKEYTVASGASLELAANNFTPAAIITESQAQVIVSGNNVDLSHSTFGNAHITVNGSAHGLTSSSADVRIDGTGTLKDFHFAAIFGPSTLTLENMTWVNGTVLEFVLGESFLTSTGSSSFLSVDDGGLTISIIDFADGLMSGDRITLLTLHDASSFSLTKFTLQALFPDGLEGELFFEATGSGARLGVEILTVPEASCALLLLGAAAHFIRQRRRTARPLIQG